MQSHHTRVFGSARTLAAIAIEFGPLVMFFIAFELFDFFTAVAVLMGTVIVSMFASWRLSRSIALFPLIASGSVIVFGMLTLVLHDPFYIELKDTLYFGGFGLAIVIPLLRGKLVLKHMFNDIFSITDKGWTIVSWRWGIMMLSIAAINEVTRVLLTPDEWVRYKFVVLILLFIFSGTLFFVSRRERLPDASLWGLRIE